MVGYVSIAPRAQVAPKQRQSAAQRQAKYRSPVAMGALPSGLLPVLDSGGKLLLLDSGKGVIVPIKETLGNFTPIDLASARLGSQELIFVIVYWTLSAQSSQAGEGLLVQYSLQGEEMRSWHSLDHTFSGLAIDTASQLIYLSDARNGAISVVNVAQTSTSQPNFVARIPGASRLGALAFDADGHRLFASDIEDGKVYIIDVTNRKSRVIAAGLGEPAALAYETTQDKLYIADASKHCVWQVPVSAATPKPSIFSSAPELRQPRGIAIGPGHTVWVADYGAGAIFSLSSTGHIDRTVR